VLAFRQFAASSSFALSRFREAVVPDALDACRPPSRARWVKRAWIAGLFLSLSGLQAQALDARGLNLARVPAPPIVASAHIGEIELHWECAQLITTPRVPPGWEVELRYAEDEGSLRVHHIADVVELADFVPIPLHALPSMQIQATADCFDYSLSISEGVEGSAVFGGGAWTRRAASSKWERAEMIE
jgi:hypothetical protein